MKEQALAARISIHIDAPPQTVWERGFATQEGWRAWFNAKTVFEPRVRGQFRIEGLHRGTYPFVFSGTVVEFEPPRRVRVTWAWDPPKYEGHTYVTFTLTPKAGGTLVEIVHDGFERLAEPFRTSEHRSFSAGWTVEEDLVPLKRLVEQGVRGPTT